MGEITVFVEVENPIDRALFEGDHTRDDIRSHRMQAVVDPGTLMLVLPQDVVEKLGLELQRTVIVVDGERRASRPVAGPVEVWIGDRSMHTDCVVGPTGGGAVVGQVVLEELDLVVDPQRGTVVPRPESPLYPLLKHK